jgi:hypothetical protein
MTVPLRQGMKIGSYIMRQRLAGRERFPLLVELEPLFQCNLECVGCGKIQHPTSNAEAADAGRAGARRDRGMRRADGLDRRRRAADPPRDRRDRARADGAQEVRLPLHQRDPDGEEARAVQAEPLLRLGRAHRRAARAPRRVGRPRGRRSTRRSRRSRRPRRGLPRHDEHDLLHARLARRACARCSTSSTTSSRSTR